MTTHVLHLKGSDHGGKRLVVGPNTFEVKGVGWFGRATKAVLETTVPGTRFFGVYDQGEDAYEFKFSDLGDDETVQLLEPETA